MDIVSLVVESEWDYSHSEELKIGVRIGLRSLLLAPHR